MRHHFQSSTIINATPETVFQWHDNPHALARLIPPWESVNVVSASSGLEDGKQVLFKIKTGPIHHKWVAEHFGYKPPHQFCDKQVSGPFKHWTHQHLISETKGNQCVLKDKIEYELHLSPLSDPFAYRFAKSKIERMFSYRHAITKEDIEIQQRHQVRNKKILISGSSGMIGTQLCAYLSMAGNDVWRLKRRSNEGCDKTGKIIFWNPKKGLSDVSLLEDFDAVIHLAGAGIVEKRWTVERKKILRDSRINDTTHLAEALSKVQNKPEVLISGSAIGIYGDRGDEKLSEKSSTDSGILGDLSLNWEKATRLANEAGIRTVNLRTGIVLSPAGGALKKMLLPFQLCLGGRLGNGQMWMSWIALDDMLSGIEFIISNESIHGPVNFTAPNPVRNSEFTKILTKTIGRPVGPPVPRFALRIAFGEMADKALLASTRVYPEKLSDSGYQFRHTQLTSCLAHVFGKKR